MTKLQSAIVKACLERLDDGRKAEDLDLRFLPDDWEIKKRGTEDCIAGLKERNWVDTDVEDTNPEADKAIYPVLCELDDYIAQLELDLV